MSQTPGATPAPAPAPAPTPQPAAELNTYQGRMTRLKTVLEKRKSSFEEIAQGVLKADRMIKVVLSAASRNPRLLECTPESMVLSMMQAAELGLEPASALQEAYLVPYKRNFKDPQGQWRSAMEAQMQPGYRGLVKLARRSGEVSTVVARAVRAKDQFVLRYGLEEVLEHTPDITGDPGEIVGFYAIALMRDGSRQFEWMTKAEVDAVRNRSKAKEDGPWVTDYEAMGKKTVLKRLTKMLPMSVEMAKALALDTQVEIGGPAVLDDQILEGELVEEGAPGAEAPKPSKAEALAQRVAPPPPAAPAAPQQPAKAPGKGKAAAAQPPAPVAPPAALGGPDDLPWPDEDQGPPARGQAQEPDAAPAAAPSGAAPLEAWEHDFLAQAAAKQRIAEVFVAEAKVAMATMPPEQRNAIYDAMAKGTVSVWNQFEPKIGGQR